MIRFPGISKMIMRSLVGKPSTLMHPQRIRVYPEATRGRVHNEIEKCIFCRMCEKNCPTMALAVSKEVNHWEIDSLKCCQCRRCVEVCPVKCLSMDNVYFPPVRSRADGKVLTVLPPGVLPAYQKAKEEAKSEKPKVIKSEGRTFPSALSVLISWVVPHCHSRILLAAMTNGGVAEPPKSMLAAH